MYYFNWLINLVNDSNGNDGIEYVNNSTKIHNCWYKNIAASSHAENLSPFFKVGVIINQ